VGGGAVDNVRTSVQAIRNGKFLKSAGDSAHSNLTAILGRTAGYKTTRAAGKIDPTLQGLV
jgi:hypothetical protein